MRRGTNFSVDMNAKFVHSSKLSNEKILIKSSIAKLIDLVPTTCQEKSRMIGSELNAQASNGDAEGVHMSLCAGKSL